MQDKWQDLMTNAVLKNNNEKLCQKKYLPIALLFFK